jgi:uncharacterized membrane protein
MEFYWAILILVCARLALQLQSPFRLLPQRQANSPDQAVADWANLNFLICLIVSFAINLVGTARVLIPLIRERDEMLPARQH